MLTQTQPPLTETRKHEIREIATDCINSLGIFQFRCSYTFATKQEAEYASQLWPDSEISPTGSTVTFGMGRH